MLRVLLFSIVFATTSLTDVSSLPTGAPIAACSTMTPNHGFAAQTTESPYKIIVTSNSITKSELLELRIEPNTGEMFKGFIVRALTDDDKVVGLFSASSSADYKMLNCSEVSETASSVVTHTNALEKSGITFQWRAAADFTGNIRFKATIVKSKEVFWTNVESNKVAVSQSNVDIANIYDACGSTKYCFGQPDNCVITKNCQYLGAVTVKDSRYIIEMLSTSNYQFRLFAIHHSVGNT